MNNPLLNAESVRWAKIARRWSLTLVLLLIVNLTLVAIAGWGFGEARSLAQADQAAAVPADVPKEKTLAAAVERQTETTDSEPPADSPDAAAIALAERTSVAEPVADTPSPAVELAKTPEPTADGAAATPEPSEPPLPQPTQPPQPALVIVNPPTSGGIVHFLVDHEIVSLDAGEYCSLTGEGPRQVVFHRGDEFENITLDLAPGVFVFIVTEAGWQLQPADDEVEEMLCELCRQVE